MLQELEFSPGVLVDDSALAAKGRYVSANQVRFVRGKAQTRYGNEKFSTTALTGIARGIHAWADRSGIPYLAVGTHTNLYAADGDGNVTDITPVTSFGYATNAITTTAGTATTITLASHGLVVGQGFGVFNQSASVGGITLSGKYVVASITDANNFVITTAVATAAGPGGGTFDYRIYLVAGNQDGLGGVGYGTGGYGSGGYGGSTSGVALYPRTWSFAPWGNNVIANPRGGAIFEWAANTSATELVTNYAFTAAASWSVGVGWSVGGGQANASATNASLTQGITLNVAAWNLLHVVASVASGSFQVYVNNVTIQAVSGTNRYNQVFFSGGGGAQTVKVTGAAFSGNIQQVSVQVQTTATQIPIAPNPATCIFSTSERILVACGVNDDNGNFDPMRVRWSDQELNQVWTAAASNLAGQYPLTNGSRIIRGVPVNGENLIFTDKTFYAMRYVPDPNVVYDFVDIGSGTGLLGPNAVCVINGVVFWKAPNGQDYFYNGGVPNPIVSNTMRRDFNDNLAWVQQDKVFSASISAWNEVQHIYPDLRDGTECSRYNKHQFIDEVWDPGLTTFTCWLDQGVFQYPIAVDTSGYIRYCEKGNSVDGAAFSWFIKSAMVRQEGGYKNMTINGVELDAAGLLGGYQMSIYATWKDIRGIHTKTFGPYNANAMSGSTPMHAKGQFLQMQWSSIAAAPTFWRAGMDLFDISKSGDAR